MGRTSGPDAISQRPRKGDHGRGPRSTQPRSVLISKALSRLLRHQAVNEGVPITSDGWVRLDHVLSWKGLSSRNGVSPPPTVEDIFQVVEENEKKRFALKLVDDSLQPPAPTKPTTESTPIALQPHPETTVSELTNTEADPTTTTPDPDTTTTSLALHHHRTTSPSPPPETYLIRASQGHSIKTITSDSSLLTPLTLSTLPQSPTCVHGTFYGAWPAIMRSGGLKRMGRNHVHFAEGPTLSELGITDAGEVAGTESSKVISGMRRDAQLLIYVDLRRCLEEEGEEGMKWWRSENGVLLTEGVEVEGERGDVAEREVVDGQVDESVEVANLADGGDAQMIGIEEDGDQHAARRGKQQQNRKGKAAQAATQDAKVVPMKYWSVVVDVKGGHGVIWKQGDGVIKELPESLTGHGTPKSRGGGRGRGRGRGR